MKMLNVKNTNTRIRAWSDSQTIDRDDFDGDHDDDSNGDDDNGVRDETVVTTAELAIPHNLRLSVQPLIPISN